MLKTWRNIDKEEEKVYTHFAFLVRRKWRNVHHRQGCKGQQDEENLEEMGLCMSLGSIFRKLERTGDHLTNIAVEIVLYIDAKVLKHRGKIPSSEEKNSDME